MSIFKRKMLHTTFQSSDNDTHVHQVLLADRTFVCGEELDFLLKLQ